MLFKPDFKFKNAYQDKYGSHANKHSGLFPHIDKVCSLEHDAAQYFDKISWRDYVGQPLQDFGHILDWENKTRQKNGWQHQGKD